MSSVAKHFVALAFIVFVYAVDFNLLVHVLTHKLTSVEFQYNIKELCVHKIPMPIEIKTPRLILKRHEPKDAPDIFELVDSNRLHLRELPWVPFAQSVEDSKKYVQDSIESWAKSSLFDYSLFLKSTGERLGALGLHSISWQFLKGEMGYWMAKKYEGFGYMTEAVAQLESISFEVGFNRLEVRCSPENTKSAAIPRRLGYSLEGVLRQNFLLNGEFRDTALYSKLKEDRVPA